MLKRGMGMILLVLASACLLGAVGCGDSGEEALTKSEFVKQGNEICKQTGEERAKIVEDAFESFDEKGDMQAQQTELVQEAIVPYEEAAKQLADLEPPEAMADQVEALIAAMEETGEKVKTNPQTAVVGLVQFEDANQKAEELNLDSCVA